MGDAPSTRQAAQAEEGEAPEPPPRPRGRCGRGRGEAAGEKAEAREGREHRHVGRRQLPQKGSAGADDADQEEHGGELQAPGGNRDAWLQTSGRPAHGDLCESRPHAARPRGQALYSSCSQAGAAGAAARPARVDASSGAHRPGPGHAPGAHAAFPAAGGSASASAVEARSGRSVACCRLKVKGALPFSAAGDGCGDPCRSRFPSRLWRASRRPRS
mmetsp:Transcript_24333/g.69100  ORF Transcript_24333/g.69100 Transcript_24333/m.69100 type:complete len:216 (-) Transcript_24333:249-896(-)